MQASAIGERLVNEVVAFIVAACPEEAKRRGPLEPFASTRMQVLSGVVEVAVATALFVVGMIRYVVAFSLNEGFTFIAHQEQSDTGTYFAVGALAYLSYFFTPGAMLLVYCVGEGLVRTFDTLLAEGARGIALVVLPWRLVETLRSRGRQARLAVLLGPRRPDEVLEPEESPSGMLEIYSVEDRPWSDVQVVEHHGRFFKLATRELVPRGPHHAYLYQLHVMEDREVIRGAVVRYQGPAAPTPVGPARDPGGEPEARPGVGPPPQPAAGQSPQPRQGVPTAPGRPARPSREPGARS